MTAITSQNQFNLRDRAQVYNMHNYFTYANNNNNNKDDNNNNDNKKNKLATKNMMMSVSANYVIQD